MTEHNGKYQMLLRVILVAALGGGIPVFSKMALMEIPTFVFIFCRFAIASLILVPVFIRSHERVAKKDVLPVILLSLFGTGNVVFFALGVKLTTATSAQVLYAASPIIALGASLVILKTGFGKGKLIGVLTGVFGVLIIVLSPKLKGGSFSSGSLNGNVLVFIAVISYTMYTVLSKRAQNRYSPITLTTAMVLTTLAVQSLLMITEIKNLSVALPEISYKAVIGVLYVGIFGTALYFLLYQHVIKKGNPVVASMTFYLQPVFSFIYAFFLLNERLTVSLVLGSLLAFVGAAIVTRKQQA